MIQKHCASNFANKPALRWFPALRDGLAPEPADICAYVLLLRAESCRKRLTGWNLLSSKLQTTVILSRLFTDRPSPASIYSVPLWRGSDS